MKLTIDYDFGNKLGPGWVVHFELEEKCAAIFYDHEPTVEDIVDFINHLGLHVEAAA